MTNIEVQKIDGTILKTYQIVVFTFFVSNKDSKKRFFEDNFLLANVKLDVMLRISFLVMNNTNINF